MKPELKQYLKADEQDWQERVNAAAGMAPQLRITLERLAKSRKALQDIWCIIVEASN